LLIFITYFGYKIHQYIDLRKGKDQSTKGEDECKYGLKDCEYGSLMTRDQKMG
jgi:hypothetical protein